MAVATRIISDHSGAISLDDNASGGTCVRLMFPSVIPSEQRPMASPKQATNDFQDRTVLLVDDEASVPESVTLLLRANGNRVISASNANDAIRELATNREEIDCLILDYSMPAINGLELLNTIRARGWKHPAILCSGYAVQIDDSQNAEHWPEEILTKPFRFEMLRQAMEKVCRTNEQS